jgi:hypothetical protein
MEQMSIITDFDNYSVLASLNERTIYLKITDNIGFLQYESNIDVKELRLSIDIKDAFTIMKKCFDKSNGYDVVFTHNTGTLKLQFNALIEGFLKMNFELFLKERIMTSDGQLTVTINRLEQKVSGLEKQLEKKNAALVDMAEKLSYSTICLWNGASFNPNDPGQYSKNLFPSINIKKLNFNSNSHCGFIDFTLIVHLYQLEELIIPGNNTFNHTHMVALNNKTLSFLEIHGSRDLPTLRGIENLPNLNKLAVYNCNALKDVPTILSSYKHKIKHLSFINCTSINVVELQTYCQKNNIQLDIK